MNQPEPLTLSQIFDNITERTHLASILEGEGEWGYFLVKVLILLVGLSTISFSLDSVEALHAEHRDLFLGIDVFCLLFFTIEYILRVSIATHKIHYACQPMSLIDLLSILPSWLNILHSSTVPRLQFFRILRLFKFLVSTRKGKKAAVAFQQSWQDNSSLLMASTYLFVSVWTVFSCLQHFAEFDNDDMLHCVPPYASELMTNSDEVMTADVVDCHCDSAGCYGVACECTARYGSVVSSMYFTLIEFSGTFQLAAEHSTLGKVFAVGTVIASVGIFAIPTSLFAAALSQAAIVIHSGDESEDGSEDDGDVQSRYSPQEDSIERYIALRVSGSTSSSVYAAAANIPTFTLTPEFMVLSKLLVSASAICSILSTLPHTPRLLVTLFIITDLACVVTFGMEYVCRVAAEGPRHTTDKLFSSFLPTADVMAWMPSMIFYLSGCNSVPPPSTSLTVALFRILKLERYTNGFWILRRVVRRSWGLLSVGGMATFCLLMFMSTLLFYTERDNPDPNVRKYYTSVPKALWTTMMNVSSGMVQVDYSLPGRAVASVLCLFSIAVFAVPIGAIGGGFRDVMSAMARHDKRLESEGVEKGLEMLTELPLGSAKQEILPVRRLKRSYGSLNENGGTVTAGRNYNVPCNDSSHDNCDGSYDEDVPLGSILGRIKRIRGVFRREVTTNWFIGVSVAVTLFGVGVETTSTCDSLYNHPLWIKWELSLEICVIIWFTVEIICRTIAFGRVYITSKLGFLDLLATVPWYIAQGMLGSEVGTVVARYDGPLRFVRLMRLMRLDTYSPSLSLIGDAVVDCWGSLKVAGYSFVVLCFFFNEWLYLSEHQSEDADYSTTPYHFRNALSSLQYTGMLLTKGYGEMDNLSFSGQLCCCTAVVAAIGISSVPASVLANSFVNLLRDEAEKDHARKLRVALVAQRMFRRKRSVSTLQGVARLAGTENKNSALSMRLYKHLMGLDAASWYPTLNVSLTVVNICVVMLESVADVYLSVDPFVWSAFESFCGAIFTLDYLCILLTIEHNFENRCSRLVYMFSLRGLCALCSVLPMWTRLVVGIIDINVESAPVLFTPRLIVLFRVLRVFRIIGLDRYIKCFFYLNQVLLKVSSVLAAAGVVALVVWVGAASLFYYAELSGDNDKGIAVFDSIPDSLYHCALFLVNDWQIQDFTPFGSALCVVLSLFGVAIFAVPVGVLFEGFQNLITEQKDNPVVNSSCRNLLK